jgi:hypothetical protein
VEDLCENVSQMGRNRAFSPLGHERSLHERHGDRGFSKDIRRSPLGRHLSRHGDRKSPNQPGGVATWGRHGDLPCKWRPSALKAWSPLRVAMATLMLQVATSSHLQGRHLWSPWRPRGASGDLYTNCSWSPLAK